MTTLSAPLVDVTPRSATTLVEQCRANTDQDLSALAKSMQVLRTHQNGLVHISCLPPEILAIVFRHFANFESHAITSRPHFAPICMMVTHVCRHWRQVALECPTLWASISSDSLNYRWIGIMLERSTAAALVVTYSERASLRDCLEQILSQLPRIEVLQISSFSSDVDHILDLLSSQPAPLLQTFEFSVIGDVIHSPRPISDNIFQGQVPQLRSVELVGCSSGWAWCIFSGLRSLSMRGITGAHPTLPQLLSALRCMPDLEQLTLERMSMISEETKVFDKVPLTRLKSMALDTGAIRTAVSFFTRLALPAPHRSGPVLRSMYAVRISRRTFGVQFSTSMTLKTGHSWDPPDDNIRLSIQFTYLPSTEVQVQPTIIFDICRIVTQGRIQNLCIESPRHILPGNFWRIGLADLLELQVIHLTRSSSSLCGLINALNVDGTQSSDVAYPSLRALEFEKVNFGYIKTDGLQAAIKMRATHGVPIHELRLAWCIDIGLMAGRVQLLEKLGVNVDWDGHEGRCFICKRIAYLSSDSGISDTELEN
ncbi:hypothetical protein DFH29DRAFT_1011594 [Suillus ampliporus]|nr:hypothetical protein DFH29DRAFT_1011594 [Suillus ampliporus]